MTELFRQLFQRELTPQDMQTYIAVQFHLEQAKVAVIDLCPVTGDVEIKWEGGRYREWMPLSEACNYLWNAIKNHREEAQRCTKQQVLGSLSRKLS